MIVGFAGIGRMGLPMARNVLAAGFDLIVWNRTAARAAEFTDGGARVVSDAAGLGEAEIVVTMLSDGAAVRDVLVDGGVLAALKPGSVVIEMSTIGPRAVVELAEVARSHGVVLVDAPVSGSVPVAEAAQLFAMVGGERDAYVRVTPVLDAMTKGHVWLGRSGAGAAMKLAVNSMIAVTNEAVAETLTLAAAFGIEREAAYDVLAGGALASPFVLYKRSAFLEPEATPVAFTTSLMRKDGELATELADELDVRLPTLAAAMTVLEEAIRNGLGDADMASVIRLLQPRSAANAQKEEP